MLDRFEKKAVPVARVARRLVNDAVTAEGLAQLVRDLEEQLTVRPPQMARGNKYRTVMPTPLVRSRIIVSPSFISACMASQQKGIPCVEPG